MRSLLAVFLLLFLLSAIAQTDDEIADLLINQSISSYPGPCACPFNAMKNGRACGGRSAYSKRGGYAPLCYRSDVTADKILAWRNAHGSKVPATNRPTAAVSKDLPVGSFSEVYDRNSWPHWVDLDGDCQDTREEVLIRDALTHPQYTSARKCKVLSGRWFDPYTGKVFDNPGQLDVDHIVPLKWANGHGGSGWSREQKKAFANDQENLISVDGPTNRAKGDKGPDEWMPPRQEYRCEYLGKFTKIVNKYQLLYAPSERRVIDRMREACGAR